MASVFNFMVKMLRELHASMRGSGIKIKRLEMHTSSIPMVVSIKEILLNLSLMEKELIGGQLLELREQAQTGIIITEIGLMERCKAKECLSMHLEAMF